MARPLVAAATSAATATASALSLVLAAFGGGEGVAASAALGGVRIVDLEAAARQRIVEVDGSALQVFNARQIDDDLHAEDLEHLVLGRDRLVLDLHAVRKPRAAAARDEDAHALICAAVLLHDGLDLGSRFLAQRYHAWEFLLPSSLETALTLVNFDVAGAPGIRASPMIIGGASLGLEAVAGRPERAEGPAAAPPGRFSGGWYPPRGRSFRPLPRPTPRGGSASSGGAAASLPRPSLRPSATPAPGRA